MSPKKGYKQLSLEVKKKRWEYSERLFRQGKSVAEVYRASKTKFGKGQNWRTLTAMQQTILAEQTTAQLPTSESIEEQILAVQPVKRVSPKLKRQLQGVVNEMQKGGIERLSLTNAGTVSVQYAPAEHLFDLEG